MPNFPNLPADAVEITSKRNIKEKHYSRPSGEQIAIFTAEPIHFKSNGQFIDASGFNSTYGRVKGKNAWRTNSDDFKVELDGQTVVINKNGSAYTYSIDGLYVDNTKIASPTYGNFSKDASGNFTITNIFPNCDLKIYLSPYQFRDELIIKQNILEGTSYTGQYLYIQYNAPLEQNILVTEKKATIKFNASLAGRKEIPLYYNHEGNILKKGINVTDMYSSYDRYPIIIDPTDSFVRTGSVSASTKQGIQNWNYVISPSTIAMGTANEYDGSTKTWSDIWYRGFLKFDLSSLNNKTISNAEFKVSAITSYSLPLYLYTTNTEYNYSTATAMDLFDVTLSYIEGKYPGSDWAWQTYTNSAIKNHCVNHRGGDCHFVLTSTESLYVINMGESKFVGIDNGQYNNVAYLSITYTEGSSSPQPNPIMFGAGF